LKLLLFHIQLANPNSWDDAAHLISIFRTNKFIETNTKNISISLYKISSFIRNKGFNGRTEKNIPYILDFDQAAWDLILFIYKIE